MSDRTSPRVTDRRRAARLLRPAAAAAPARTATCRSPTRSSPAAARRAGRAVPGPRRGRAPPSAARCLHRSAKFDAKLGRRHQLFGLTEFADDDDRVRRAVRPGRGRAAARRGAVRPGRPAAQPDRRRHHLRLRRARLRRLGLEPRLLPGRRTSGTASPAASRPTRGSCDAARRRRRTRCSLRRRPDRRRAARRCGTAPGGGFAAQLPILRRDAQRHLRAAGLLHRDLRRRARRADRRPGVPARRGAAAVAGEGRPAGRVRRHRAGRLGVLHARRRPARRASTSCGCSPPAAATAATPCSSSRAPSPASRAAAT